MKGKKTTFLKWYKVRILELGIMAEFPGENIKKTTEEKLSYLEKKIET